MTSAVFLTVQETADLFRVSDDLVYDLIARGDLPAARFGNKKRIPRRAVDMVLDRALDGFDPDRVLARMGVAVDSPAGDPSAAGEPTRATSAAENSHRGARLELVAPPTG